MYNLYVYALFSNKVKHTVQSQTICEDRTESHGSHVDRQVTQKSKMININQLGSRMQTIRLLFITIFSISLLGAQSLDSCPEGEYSQQGTGTCISGTIDSSTNHFLPDCSGGERRIQGIVDSCSVTEAALEPELVLPSCEEGERLDQGTNTCVDLTAPIITLIGPDPQILEIGVDSYVEFNATANDNTDGNISSNIVIDSSAVNVNMVGNYVVSYSVSDAAGYSTTVRRDVNVTDTIDPEITLNGNATDTVEVAQGSTYSDPGVTITDDSGEMIPAVVTGSVDTTRVDRYVLTYTATDSSGNDSNVSRTVNVVDTTLPVVSVIGANPLDLLIGETYIEYNATVVDNSGESLIASVESNTVNTSKKGSYEVVYLAIDASGNKGRATRVVNVLDRTAPVIKINGANPMYIDQYDDYTELDANVTDNSGETIDAVISGTVDTSTVATYTLTYTATDSSMNESTATRTVHVLDKTAPEIVVSGDNPYTAEVGTTYTDPGVTATDAVDGNIDVDMNTTALDMSTIGVYTVTFSAKDSAGNEATASRNVNVTDTTPPELILNGRATVNIVLNDPYTELNATVTDNSGESLSVEVIGDVNTSALGEYHVSYNATDSSGNTGWTHRTVNVVDEIVLQANNDWLEPDTIEEIIVPVLENDDVPDGETISSILLIDFYDGNAQPVYATWIERQEGIWRVDGDTVVFTPNANYGGGQVDIEYQIEDSNGDKSISWVGIEYPIFVQAQYDENQTDNLDPFTVDVLENDTIAEGSIITVQLANYDNNNNRYFTSDPVESWDGNWMVVDDTVVFTPNQNFSGGSVWIEYQISDEEGRSSTAGIEIVYPIFVQAQYDQNQTDNLDPFTVDVLANDNWGEGIDPIVMLQNYDEYGNPLSFTLDPVVLHDGTWNIEDNQSVTFTPNENFNSRYAQIEYQLSDGDGHTSQTWISIEYPVSIYAEQDYVQRDDIESVTIDVVANDTNVSAVTVKFEIYYNGTQYVDSVESFDGNWTVEDNQSVTFTPNANFGGGNVWMWYQITDQELRTSETWISIEYPVYVYAEWDPVEMDTMDPAIVDVLTNDINTSAVTIELVNKNWSTGSEEVGTTITTDQGVWSVNGSEVIFEPHTDFGGGYVRIEYQITDTEGHMSRTSIEIIYPVGPTPVCTVDALNTVESVYTTLTNDLSFENDNGRRDFEPELDLDDYTIDSALYTDSTAVTGLSPMYMVWYEEETRTTSSGDTFIEVRLDTTEVLLDGTDSWSFKDQKTGNDRGYKYTGSRGESGTYVVEDDGSNTLSIGENPVFAFKVVRQISKSEINTILENAGINLILDPNDIAQMQLSKELESDYDWWGPVDGNNYDSLDAFIAGNEHNSSATQFNDNGVLRSQTWQKVIIFAENSAGQTSGTLIEIDRQTNEILVANAGTWNIEEDDNGNDIIVAKTTLCGYEDHIFKLDGTTIIQGHLDEAGTVSAELAFSKSLKVKLEDYFILNAPLDIDPANPNSPVITESMLTDKIFYTVEDQEDNAKLFKKITVDSNNYLFTKREIYVLGDGTIVNDKTETNSYELDDGRIRIQGEGDVKIGLNADPGSGDWDVTIYTWDWMGQEMWLLNEPADFPQ